MCPSFKGLVILLNVGTGSIAALYQASILGAFIAKGTFFATCQSIGALGVLPLHIKLVIVLSIAALILAIILSLKG